VRTSGPPRKTHQRSPQAGWRGYARAIPDSTKPPRRFPPPWSIAESKACFVAKDSTGQKLSYVYLNNLVTPRREDDLPANHCNAQFRGDGKQELVPVHHLVKR
jgi:hypothetical protein